MNMSIEEVNEEYFDELSLYIDYFSGGNYCKAEIDNIEWNYSNTFTNDNIDGFEPPNVKYNELDYTVKYEFKIFDVVENYEEKGSQGAGDGGWWNAIGNLDEGEWTTKWNQLQREGWDTWGERIANHPYGISNKIIFTAGPFSQGPNTDNTMTAIIDDGFTFRFDYPSIYTVTVFATDTYGVVGETTKVVDARDIVKFNQTLLVKYSPWQGFNISGSASVPNSKYVIESRDIDKRPSLGLWYYDELPANKSKKWETLHLDKPYESFDSAFTGSLQSKYFDG